MWIGGLREVTTQLGNLLSNRTFHNQKLRSNTIRNVRGFYQIALRFKTKKPVY